MTYAQENFIEDFRSKWKNGKEFTLEYAEIMPAEKYSYKPSEEEKPYNMVILHMLQNMIWISNDYLHGDFENPIKTADPNKAEIIQMIHLVYDHVDTLMADLNPHRLRDKVRFFAGETTVLKMIELTDDHASHHRGQLSVYLRMNGIKPPKYRGW